MNILVTGGAGYIGSQTVQDLLSSGFSVETIDDLSTGRQSSLPKEVKCHVGNILDKNFIDQVFSSHHYDAVIHFAAKISVKESVERPLYYYENNVGGTLNILEACDKYKVNKFIFSSTAAVYGNSGNVPVDESASLKPINPYGRSKMMSESIIDDFSKVHPDFKYVILRYFNVAGANIDCTNGQISDRATHLIKVCCEAAVGKRKSISIFGSDYETKDGTGVRDYIHVLDLAKAHVLSLNYLTKNGNSDIFNCGYGHGYSVKEVVASIQKISGKSFTVDVDSRREGDSAFLVAANEKIKSIIGWKPQYDNLDLICKTAFSWEQKINAIKLGNKL